MPTLVVHTRQLKDARDLLREIGVQAELVAYEGKEKEPKPEDVPRIRGAEVAFIGVRKEYRRAAERLGCTTRFKLESVGGSTAALVAWLHPTAPQAKAVLTPRAAFEEGALATRGLLLADGALDTADRLVTTLHPF